MIVNAIDDGWEIIYQRAHGLLAAKLAMHWRVKNRPAPERWDETIAAILEHDNSGREWAQKNHLNEAHAPQDFTHGELSDHQPRERMEDAQHQTRWVALLTSMHFSYLYEHTRGRLPAMDQFLDEQQALQKQWIKALEMDRSKAEAAYAVMRLFDRLSLILCQRGLPARDRALEIDKDGTGQRYDVLRREADQTVMVQPWCFEEDEFTVSIEAIHLDQMTFRNDKELIETMKNSRVEVLTWKFRK